MCGIFAFLELIKKGISLKQFSKEDILTFSSNITHRGPDDRENYNISKNVDNLTYNLLFDFHRLSINDLSISGRQPMFLEDYVLMTNGEIYNHNELYNNITNPSSLFLYQLSKKYDITDIPNYKNTLKSTSDCEIILHFYSYLVDDLKLELEIVTDILFSYLDGVFATIIYDKKRDIIILGRDAFGVRPMYFNIIKQEDYCRLSFCSELKGLVDFDEKNVITKQFNPHSFSIIDLKTLNTKVVEKQYTKYINYFNPTKTYEDASNHIKYLLENAVEKRLMSDRPIGCLLSGGLDSSLVTSIVVNMYKKRGVEPKNINTFSIGLKGSPDLKYARCVAEYLGTNHHEILMTVDEMIESVPETIKTIESYDITTVRASTPNRLLAKYIKENTDITVIFSGEGADELFGGYLYFHNAPSFNDFQKETYRRMENLYMYDVQRCDRTTASQSLEVRVPFLDKSLTNYVMSLPGHFKMSCKYLDLKDNFDYNSDKKKLLIEKHILRNAFNGYLPDNVLWRMKDAFSDAVGYNWINELKKYCDTKYPDYDKNEFEYNNPETSESYYFRKLFTNYYGKENANLLTEIWRPLWTDIKDPSATLLKSHTKDN